ncbi:DUF4435 domain-containing protein [Tenacibaculum sp. 1_MG-2023]|uniref:DUF4435 domain-containing protein n=1 Tax=Tenacibaculum sp. 1_MG-2023 TaxID=3062653 RepID=UPI0026E2675A|nr:DUF4435 domain-containing protein [Tenacibaculum sp. 1_MG-2023]MDO6676905.1 DUF4435 domain-containing protein [Tenacibaculum sp. 1_MG-2023]
MSFIDSFFAKKDQIRASSGVFRLRQKYSSNNQEVHIFVEDEDDYVFYQIPLKQLYVDYKIIPYFQKGKKNVLDAYNEINWTNYIKEKVLFFIDKDFDDLLGINNKLDSNVFVTKYYSIENYLVTVEVFEIILMRFFGIKERILIDEFLGKINNAHNEFIKNIKSIISLILIYRKESKHMDLDKIKLSNFFYLHNLDFFKRKVLSVEDYNIIMRDPNSTNFDRVKVRKEKTLNNILSECVEDTSVYDYAKLIENRKTLETCISEKIYIRGKYEFWFLFEMLTSIEQTTKRINETIRSKNVLIEKECDKISLYKKRTDINANNIFDIFPSKIKMPEDIKTFLELNYNRL